MTRPGLSRTAPQRARAIDTTSASRSGTLASVELNCEKHGKTMKQKISNLGNWGNQDESFRPWKKRCCFWKKEEKKTKPSLASPKKSTALNLMRGRRFTYRMRRKKIRRGFTRLSYDSCSLLQQSKNTTQWCPTQPKSPSLVEVAYPRQLWSFVALALADVFFFSPTAKLAMGSLAQNSSGAIRCSCNPRFRRRFRKVPEGSGADSRQGSGRFRCRWLMSFRMVPVSIADTVLEAGSGAESWWGSGGFRAESWLGSGGFRLVPAHIADKVPKVLV